MKRVYAYLVMIVSVVMLTGFREHIVLNAAQGERAERVLVWSDEFEETDIDLNKWSATQDVYVENGCAVLPVSFQKDTNNWSESWLTTEGRFGFQYGRLEARIKMTAYPGEFPAFWTMGYNKQSKDAQGDIDGCRWSKCGEIDIMEEYDANGVGANPGAALHWCNYWLERNQSRSIGKLANLDTRQWHVYAMEWDADGIEIFYDEVSVGYIDYNELDYYNDMNPFSMPQFILFDNLIINEEVANTSLTPKMWIDWVRVYAPKEESNVVTETEITMEEIGTRKAIKDGRIAVGDSAYMDVVFTPENVVNQSYQLISMDEDIIHVNGGVLTAVTPGKTEVVAVSPNGKMYVLPLEVFYDDRKNNLSKTSLEKAESFLIQENTWYWGEYIRSLDSSVQKIHTGLIKVSPNTNYEIVVKNQCLAAKINIIEYRSDGTYIKWADYNKQGILKTGNDAAYIRINMTLSKSGMTMNYGDYLEYMKYTTITINN